jgi:hypothetical protein
MKTSPFGLRRTPVARDADLRLRFAPLTRVIKVSIPAVVSAGLLFSHFRVALADEARERLLEARITALEHRLEEIEAKDRHGHREPSAKMTPLPRAAPSLPPDITHADPQVAAASVASPPSGVEAGPHAETPQETFVFRENSVTLKPRHVEISTDADYIRANGFLQADRAFASATSIRLGILDWLEVNATVPVFTAARTRGVGPFQTQTKEVSSIGDVLLQANARLHEQTGETPGLVLSLGVLLPTGRSPYDFATYQPDPSLRGYNPNPTDRNAAYLSRGAWGLNTNLQIYKTVDPLILFFGAGLRYLLPQELHGHTVQAGEIYTYNMGFSFALSEKSTLGFQIAGSYESRLLVDHRIVPQSEIEPISTRLSLIQRIFPDTWVEPSLGAGLTQDAPNLDVGLGVRHRF